VAHHLQRLEGHLEGPGNRNLKRLEGTA